MQLGLQLSAGEAPFGAEVELVHDRALHDEATAVGDPHAR
jgi:hypothetical protein